MKRLFAVIWVALAAFLATACSAAGTPDSAAPKIQVPSGTTLRVVLQEGIGTDVSSPGAEFSARLAEPIVIDEAVVVPTGTPVTGRVTDVRQAGRVKGRASLSLVLTTVVHNGEPVPLETETWVGVAKPNTKRDAAVIAGAAGIGAAIGAIAGGGKGTATGAAVGGAGGTGAVLATRGDDVHYPPETRLNFVLKKSVEM